MSFRVTFIVEKGSLLGQSFTYSSEKTLVLGRRKDCSIVFSDSTVSSQHCIVEVSSQSVTVKDCSSLNGTFINGERVGQREAGDIDNDAEISPFQMKSGDRLGLGKSCELRLEIVANQHCTICSNEIEDVTYRDPDGEPICNECYKNPDKVLKHLIEKAQSD